MTQDFYKAFEDRYRGSRELIKERLRVYLPFVQPLRLSGRETSVLDLGCGRGEWLELMLECGFKAQGVDLDDGMLAACLERGLDATQDDALSALHARADDSVMVVTGFHLAEHLGFDDLQSLIREVKRVLRPEGLMILETPNPENLVVASNNFHLDPTHQKPLPQQLLAFLAEHQGFERVKVIRLQQASDFSGAEHVALLDVLQGVSPDYAVVAQKSLVGSPDATSAAFENEYGVGLDFLARKYEAQLSREREAVAALAAQLKRLPDQLTQLEGHLEGQLASSVNEKIATLEENLAIRIARHKEENHERSIEQREMLGAVGARLSALEGSVRAVEDGLQSMNQSGWSWFVKTKVARPLIIATHRAMPAQSRLKSGISATLQTHFPGIHDRLQGLVRRQSAVAQLSSDRAHAPVVRHATSNLHPALSDPDLAALERPLQVFLDPESLHWAPSSENLEPIVELNQMRQSAASVCFFVSVRQDDASALERTLQSVLRQTDPSWEVLLCATSGHERLLDRWLEIDWRVRRVAGAVAGTEGHQLATAVAQCTTNFVGMLSQGDVVDDDLVKMLGERLRDEPDLDVIYTDEASRLDGDKVGKQFYKPDWSPEHQQSVNMVGRFAAIRKGLLLGLDDPDEHDDAAAEYRLMLNATSRARSVGHIDELLYFRANSQESPLGGFFPAASLAEARAALEKHVQKEAAGATVKAIPASGSLQVTWPMTTMPVTLAILTGMYEKEIPDRGRVNLAMNFVKSIIAKSTCANYRILVVDDGFVPDELSKILAEHNHSSISYPKQPRFSFADKANFASLQVSSGIVILLNDDLEVIAPDWIQALASQAARPEVGVVGGKLQFPDGTLQHVGIALGFHGSAGHIFHRASSDGSEYAGFANVDRNYSAVTGAVMAYRRDVFDAVGGFDSEFSTDYNDLDFCLKCIKAGYRVVYTPKANLYHFHNSSLKRVHDNDVERRAFLKKWNTVVARDPYFSKHFQTKSHDQPLLEAIN